jgi:hypothetical protein
LKINIACNKGICDCSSRSLKYSVVVLRQAWNPCLSNSRIPLCLQVRRCSVDFPDTVCNSAERKGLNHKHMNTTIENTTSANPKAEVTFGTGRYSNVARELYNDSQRLLKIAPEQAERLAKTYASELGRLNAKVGSVSIGKPNKDMQCTLRESTQIKGVTMTYALTLAKLCVVLQDAKKYGIEAYNNISLRKDVIEWLDNSKGSGDKE